MRLILTICLIGFIASLISACGGKQATQEAAATSTSATTASADITKPPVVVEANRPAEEEGNPDETISFDEWRRQRQAEQGDNP